MAIDDRKRARARALAFCSADRRGARAHRLVALADCWRGYDRSFYVSTAYEKASTIEAKKTSAIKKG